MYHLSHDQLHLVINLLVPRSIFPVLVWWRWPVNETMHRVIPCRVSDAVSFRFSDVIAWWSDVWVLFLKTTEYPTLYLCFKTTPDAVCVAPTSSWKWVEKYNVFHMCLSLPWPGTHTYAFNVCMICFWALAC